MRKPFVGFLSEASRVALIERKLREDRKVGARSNDPLATRAWHGVRCNEVGGVPTTGGDMSDKFQFNGALLRELRLARVDPETGNPWSAAYLGEVAMRKVGVRATGHAVLGWETGNHIPDTRFILAICEVFGKTTEDFYV